MTTKRYSHALSGVLSFALLLPIRAETSSPPLLSQTSTVTLECPGDIHHGHWKWSHGAFVYAFTPSGLSPTFYTLSRDGKFVSSVTPQVPDTTGVSLIDFDRDTDGSLVYSGWSASAYGQPQPFLIYLSPEGQTTQVIPLDRYWPYMLSIAPDGTIWTLGTEGISRYDKTRGLNPDADVLRHFDRAGKLLNSGLPQSTFMKGHQTMDLSYGFLVVTAQRLSWYAPKYEVLAPSEYVEISPKELQSQSYPGLAPPTKKGGNAGFAVTDAGDVFVSYEDHTNPLPRLQNYHHHTVYRFDRATSQWVPISVSEFGKYPDSLLIGADGDQLVFRSDYSASFMRVSP